MKSILINKVKLLIQSFQKLVLPLCAKSAFTSSLYFTFFSRDFYYEHKAILQAKLAYKNNNGIHGKSSALLRRNIHRLEKGLIMRPRRDVFALDYLLETIQVYKSTNQVGGFSKVELDWANSVLNEYFSVVDCTHPKISYAYNIYSQIENSMSADQEVKLPYVQANKATHDINYQQLMKLCSSRRSTRWYKNKSVENEKIHQAAAIALQAPSACNRQPYEFYTIQSQPLLSKLVDLPGGTAGFSSNIPCLIAVVGDLSYYPEARDRHVIYIDGALASMQFMLAIETLGLASCPINWPELHTLDRKVSQLLGLPQYKRVVMFMSVGYPDETGYIAYSEKKPSENIVIGL
ncbi:nitroreductase family protein [Pseudoalteromonas sp. 2CM41L]|uniref:nitroreductase family protein n=1 Tax=unclassified Pseudoalteromonas TaxID=194690 RepID=UPI0020BFFEAD|nr:MULTISPECIES: nitroreductase family protein [unclassified Pseudoalteromonas]MCK8107727.1 nitroreductase family protein [Pseudoalteromonas sp. 2CM41L]MCK8132681.1 nitroreductase family protein [Pseudoalteromonas sp. 2CM28B]